MSHRNVRHIRYEGELFNNPKENQKKIQNKINKKKIKIQAKN